MPRARVRHGLSERGHLLIVQCKVFLPFHTGGKFYSQNKPQPQWALELVMPIRCASWKETLLHYFKTANPYAHAEWIPPSNTELIWEVSWPFQTHFPWKKWFGRYLKRQALHFIEIKLSSQDNAADTTQFWAVAQSHSIKTKLRG